MQTIQKLTDAIQYIGCNDRRLEKFENIFPLNDGVSYNSFLINDEKTAVLDTVDSAVTEQFLENVQAALAGRALDYIVVNHMEPDHCGNILELTRLYPQVEIVANKKALGFLEQFYPQADLKENYYLVKEGDTLSLGQHELTFIFAPMVHWPEVIFTYEKKEKILFSADAFGTFGALHGNLFTDELDYNLLYGEECRRYYTNIIGKYGKQVTKAMEKASKFGIQMIAPLHGPIWRKNVSYIWDRYKNWRAYEPEKKGAVLVYASIYGNTASAIDYLATQLSCHDIVDLRVYDVSKAHPSYIIADIFKYSHLIIASSTYNLNIFPPMQAFLDEMKQLDIKNRCYAVIGNGSWSPTATKQLEQFFAACKNWRNIADPLTLSTALSDDQKAAFDHLAAVIADSIKSDGAE